MVKTLRSWCILLDFVCVQHAPVHAPWLFAVLHVPLGCGWCFFTWGPLYKDLKKKFAQVIDSTCIRYTMSCFQSQCCNLRKALSDQLQFLTTPLHSRRLHNT